MREKCLIIGTGGHCRAVLSILQEENSLFLPIGILDLKTPVEGEKILEVPVIGGIDDLENLADNVRPHIFLAIGDNSLRAEIFSNVQSFGLNLPNVVSCSAYVGKSVTMGKGNIIFPFAFLGPASHLGDNNIFNTRCTVEHEAQIGSHCHLAPASLIAGRVHLESNIFLGMDAKIIDKRTVVSNTVIGAGSLVLKDIQHSGVYFGIPAMKQEHK